LESVADDVCTSRNTHEGDKTVAAQNREGNKDNNQANDAVDGAGEEVNAAQLMDMLTFENDEPDDTNNNDAYE
jgi:hypothetical protein